jgi:hypothetical protein
MVGSDSLSRCWTVEISTTPSKEEGEGGVEENSPISAITSRYMYSREGHVNPERLALSCAEV